MRKRVVSLAMAAAMALSLTACGSSSSKTETTAAATEAAKTETTAAAEGAATEAAASGVDTSAWKDKTVTCIVPYDAGGGTDTVMRALADAAKGSFKNISVENRREPFRRRRSNRYACWRKR